MDRLLGEDLPVVGFENFTTGFEENLSQAGQALTFMLIRGDLMDPPALTRAMAGCDFVFHLAANADVRFGLEHPRRDREQNIVATFNVLEAMRSNGISRIAFSSTGSRSRHRPWPRKPEARRRPRRGGT